MQIIRGKDYGERVKSCHSGRSGLTFFNLLNFGFVPQVRQRRNSYGAVIDQHLSYYTERILFRYGKTSNPY